MIKKFFNTLFFLSLATLLFSNFKIFAYWNQLNTSASTYASISVAYFNIYNCYCPFADIVIDDDFRAEYMTFDSGEWTWKTDEYGNVVNYKILKKLTPFQTIIKADFCYEVVSSKYNMVDHGIPSKQNPLSWALKPLCLRYFEGWAYIKDRVVKCDDGNFYMARYYNDRNPLINRVGWDKIEPLTNLDFEFFEGTQIPDYNNVKIQNVVRSYVWDEFTEYHTFDEVTFSGSEYRCISNNVGYEPEFYNWAWEKL